MTATPPRESSAPVPISRRESLRLERSQQSVTTSPVRPIRVSQSTRGNDATRSRSGRLRVAKSVLLRTSAATAALLFLAAIILPVAITPAAHQVIAAPRSTAEPGQQFSAANTTDPNASRDSYSVTNVITPSSLGLGGTGIATTESTAIRWPLPQPIEVSSNYGYRNAPCASCSSSHQGLDMTPGEGSPIGAVADGVVRFSGYSAGFGQYVILDHIIDGGRISTLYAHMQYGSSPMRTGQSAEAGDLVGLVGNTGRSTGAHLHLEVLIGGFRGIDPWAWLTSRAEGSGVRP